MLLYLWIPTTNWRFINNCLPSPSVTFRHLPSPSVAFQKRKKFLAVSIIILLYKFKMEKNIDREAAHQRTSHTFKLSEMMEEKQVLLDENTKPGNETISEELSGMSNYEIGTKLFNFVLSGKRDKLQEYLAFCKLLQVDSSTLDLNEILNKKLYGEQERPLIVQAAIMNNLEIVKLLIKFNVSKKYILYLLV